MRPISALFASLVLAGAAAGASAEVTKTLKAELSADPSRPFRVENLVGHMVVRQGPGSKVVVIATVHGHDQATVDLLRLEEVRDSKTGHPTLRMRYPIDQHTNYRYGRRAEGGFFEKFFSGKNNVDYDGARLSVSASSGLALYADLVVEIPRGASGTFKNAVGALDGNDVDGTLRFDAGSGVISLRGFKGDVTADTGSGDVNGLNGQGTFKCDTGSGTCTVNGFRGDQLWLDTGSGDVKVNDASATRVNADTGSGSVLLNLGDAEEIKADTGSGDVSIEVSGTGLTRIKADTGSGSVNLKVPQNIGFEMLADVGRGEVSSSFADATAIMKRREVKGYRRGDLKVKIVVDTGSGDVHIGASR